MQRQAGLAGAAALLRRLTHPVLIRPHTDSWAMLTWNTIVANAVCAGMPTSALIVPITRHFDSGAWPAAFLATLQPTNWVSPMQPSPCSASPSWAGTYGVRAHSRFGASNHAAVPSGADQGPQRLHDNEKTEN
eukprot:365310-Chlamydomonas_euryale.AAC.4